MNWEECCKKLISGDYDHGWPDHEIIPVGNTERGMSFASTYGKPIWKGKSENITLLINAEFGDGDTIHFWRFVEEAKKRVSKVILRCNEDFKDLFRGVDLVSKNENIPEFDKIIHMMALPKVLGVKTISGTPYIEPNNDCPPPTVIQCISTLKFHKFGVCWAGNPFNPKNEFRSIPIDLLSRLNVVEGMTFFNLCKSEDPPESYIDLRSAMGSWNDTAHVLKLMTLVITVDTAIAHLAGSMGVPVWMVTPDQSPDWRWGLDGEKTVWYDSMKLYRRNGSWDQTMDRLADDFKLFLDGLSSPSGVRYNTSAVVE